MAKKFITSLKVLVGRSLVWTTEGSEEVSKENYMKRYGNLFEKIISLENLRLADEKARKGKTKTKGVIIHDENREGNILKLYDELLVGTYRTSEYTYFTITEPKRREVARLPYYPDRIVHHAIINVMEPIWVNTFTHNTFACIKKRGIHGCRRYVEKIIRSFHGKLYCLKIDIKKFYPSVKNWVLMKLIRKKIKDSRLLALLDEIICSAEGLPIGNYLSQYFANLTLAYFMHFVNEELRVKATEYADDIVFFSDTKEKLHDVLEKIGAKLSEMGLTIKENFQIFPIAKNVYDKVGRALDYVGYCFYRTHVRIRKSIKQNFCRRVAKLNKVRDIPLKTYKMAICSWLGWCKYSDSKHLLSKIIRIDYYEKLFKQKARCA